MSSRSRGAARRPVAIALSPTLAFVGPAAFAAATGHAAGYTMANCAVSRGAPVVPALGASPAGDTPRCPQRIVERHKAAPLDIPACL
jgi:hypothetical protein